MSAQSRIKSALLTLIDNGLKSSNKAELFIATVDDVDIDTRSCSCTLISGTSDISLDTVLLMASVDDGILIIPTKGSTVIIENTHDTQPIVVMFSQVDSVLIGGKGRFLIDQTHTELEGNKFFGLVKVKELTDKINALEKLVNDLISKFNSHEHVAVGWAVAGGGGGTTGGTTNPTLTTEGSTISPLTTQSDLENTKVKHGDGS